MSPFPDADNEAGLRARPTLYARMLVPNSTRLIAAALCASLVAFGATACGGDDSSELDTDSTAAVAQINSTCDDWRAALDARGDFPVDDFDPDNPSPEDLPAVGDYFASGFDANEKAISAIGNLSVPSEIQEQVDALVDALENELESAREQASAAKASDVEAFKATLETAAASQEAVEDAADELGGSSCAF